ncbi:MAG: ABC transporter ATP-binding protein, partial [Methylicorpusculum sp.]|nr:ABC transporter ATP-binding protein [Methylicorpusculum sp.]
SLLLVANGSVQAFDGDLDDYRQWLTDQKKGEEDPSTANNAVNVSRKDQRKQDAERRHKLKPLVDAIKRAEQTVEKLHQQQFTIEQQLADPVIYQETEKNRLKQLLEQKAQVDRDLSRAEEAWLTAESKLEEAQEACTSG